jgi:hypothetical protein
MLCHQWNIQNVFQICGITCSMCKFCRLEKQMSLAHTYKHKRRQCYSLALEKYNMCVALQESISCMQNGTLNFKLQLENQKLLSKALKFSIYSLKLSNK